MKNIFLINNLNTLNVKKDSSLLLAHTLNNSTETYICEEKNFCINNTNGQFLSVHLFKSYEKNFYLESFELKEKKDIKIDSNTIIHMRIDPPYDGYYQSILWMLLFIEEKTGAKIINHPMGIMKHNEKLLALKRKGAIPSYIGADLIQAKKFVLEKTTNFFIVKPLNLFSGIGVKRISHNQISELDKLFDGKTIMIVQPFIDAIYKGEVRAIFYKEKHLGSILKKPQTGEFLTNIAQGANFEKCELSLKLTKECENICSKLNKDGVSLVAFDILDGKFSEINTTCPGLLVELSSAHNQNFCEEIIQDLL